MCQTNFKHFFYLVLFIIVRSSTALHNVADVEVKVYECPPWEGVPTYWPYPYDCRKFIECSNGEAIVHSCPPFTVWDQALFVCNHESVTPCLIVTTETPASTSTTSGSTTATPTTTTPTTTTPITNTPTTTTLTTTTTPTPDPVMDGGVYTIVNSATGMAISVYKSNLTNGNKVHALPHLPSCSDLSQVWQLRDPWSDVDYYYIRTGLRNQYGQQWGFSLRAGENMTPDIQVDMGTYGVWKLDPVPGTRFYTLYQRNYGRFGNIRYTGVANDIGFDLDIVEPNSTVSEQQWGFVRCPGYT
ncbi:uncharacterized protein LOC110855275 isoform X2 [Folsomia candida]|uniref:uncharacterized protein LOC110855275 isoform X2 n=1 Tax=Folsomia candida TaxID=158441 RepID=UPI000B90551A|nr:uncharacterized protein LOC110855275 isoform X2 [Folsomia candida]